MMLEAMFINLDKNKVVRWRWGGFVACKLLNIGSALPTWWGGNMLYDSGPMRLLEPFWTVALLGTLLSLWCLQQCMEWRTNRWSQPSSIGRSNCSAVGRLVPAENGAETKHRRKLKTTYQKNNFSKTIECSKDIQVSLHFSLVFTQ